MTKKGLIFGITGMDGSYLAELLLEKGYEVIGAIRRTSTLSTERISHILGKITLESVDLLDSTSVNAVITKYKPDEIYNLAAVTLVPTSWLQPILTADVNSVGVLRILEAIRLYSPDSKFYQASTSEMFGKVMETPQRETTPFHPRSPYGCSKVFSHYAVQNYREAYNLFGCSGILFNHTSPRQSEEFVPIKISNAVAKISMGLQSKLYLGNLQARRDFGFAGDYVRAMWMMLQQDKPDDYVIGSGETHTIEELCKIAFEYVGMNYNSYVEIDPKFYRIAETDVLIADATKAKTVLGWQPEYTFEGLVKLLVEGSLKEIKK